MKTIGKLAVMAAVLVFCAACASTRYTAYEGGGVQQGSGGAKTVVNGIDIWKDGTPPRRFKILGIVDDKRSMGWATGPAFYPDLAEEAKKVGGDAVILLSAEREISGVDSYGNAHHDTITKAEVIKYVK